MYIAQTNGTKEHRGINKIIWTFIYFLITQFLVNDNTMFLTVGIFLAIGYSIFATVGNVFCLLCGLSMFEAVFSIQGNNAWFIILLIFVVKIIINNKMIIDAMSVCSCILLCCMEVVLDFNAGFGQIVVTVSCIVFVFLSFTNISKINAHIYDIIYALSVAFWGVVYYVITKEGGIGRYISSFMSASYAYRFGHAYGETVGGAMAIPLYASMIVSCIVTYFLLEKGIRAKHKIFSIVTMSISLIVGAMTVSRSFYLCLILVFFLFLLFRSKGRELSKFGIAFVILIVIAIVVFTQADIVDKLFESLQLRMDAGVEKGTGGRTDIWKSCIAYLLDNPIRLLFGSGATNYKLIGEARNEMFSAGAHNLILDLLMSWGILGFVTLMAVFGSALKRIIESKAVFDKHALIPLFTYLIFSMTALRCCSMKTWVFLLIAYVFANHLNKGESYDT